MTMIMKRDNKKRPSNAIADGKKKTMKKKSY